MGDPEAQVARDGSRSNRHRTRRPLRLQRRSEQPVTRGGLLRCDATGEPGNWRAMLQFMQERCPHLEDDVGEAGFKNPASNRFEL